MGAVRPVLPTGSPRPSHFLEAPPLPDPLVASDATDAPPGALCPALLVHSKALCAGDLHTAHTWANLHAIPPGRTHVLSADSFQGWQVWIAGDFPPAFCCCCCCWGLLPAAPPPCVATEGAL